MRSLFIGGPKDGEVVEVEGREHTILAVERHGDDPLTAKDEQVTYMRKTFAAGTTRIDVFVRNYDVNAGQMLQAIAKAAGIDTYQDHNYSETTNWPIDQPASRTKPEL